MQIEKVKLTDLILDPSNARKHSPKNLEAIKGSLAKFGQQKPIVVSADNVVIAGNGTLEAARALNWDHIDVHRSVLSGTEAIAYALADNRTGELAEWNADILSTQLESLRSDGYELADIGFDIGDFPQPSKEGLTDDDAVPEVAQNEFNVEIGQIWQLGDHRLMCGDSTNADAVARLMNGEKADMVFTDPPYGVGYEGGHNKKKRNGIQNDELVGDGITNLFGDSLRNALGVTNDNAAFYIWYANGKAVETFAAFARLSLKVRAVICWYKVRSGLGAFMSQYIPNYEPCIYAHKEGCAPQWFGPSDEKTVWELQKERINNFHPTQKPVALGERAISNSSKNGQSVLDPFLGSGSTLIACDKTNRKCFGMEIDPHYCSVVIKRWQDFTGKKANLV